MFYANLQPPRLTPLPLCRFNKFRPVAATFPVAVRSLFLLTFSINLGAHRFTLCKRIARTIY